jgi:hypothetical protein
MTNEKVIRNWINNRKGKSLNMSTDGKSLFSYRIKIAFTYSNELSPPHSGLFLYLK